MAKSAGIEIWVLLAKYLTHEASESERAEAEVILAQDEVLKSDLAKLSIDYYLHHTSKQSETQSAFLKLNERIKH